MISLYSFQNGSWTLLKSISRNLDLTGIELNYARIWTDKMQSYSISGSYRGKLYNLVYKRKRSSLIGDMNGNGKIDLSDLILILKVISGEETDKLVFSDTDGDGKIDLKDAIYVLQRLSALK